MIGPEALRQSLRGLWIGEGAGDHLAFASHDVPDIVAMLKIDIAHERTFFCLRRFRANGFDFLREERACGGASAPLVHPRTRFISADPP